jgi:hypothetical protein
MYLYIYTSTCIINLTKNVTTYTLKTAVSLQRGQRHYSDTFQAVQRQYG